MEAEKKAFKITKREIGFVLGIIVFLLVKFLPLAELSSTVELTVGGQTCLALTLATVVFWACGVAQPGFVGLLYCALLVLFKVCVDDTGAASISATVASTFSSWTKATMWLVIGAYLIASAVKESGLGERIAYAFMLKFVRDAKSLIISIFALTFVLSLLIPHPFPRAFLILAVVSVIAESAGYGDDDKGKLGFPRLPRVCRCRPGFHVLPDGRLHAQPARCAVQRRGRRHEPVLYRLVPVHERAHAGRAAVHPVLGPLPL